MRPLDIEGALADALGWVAPPLPSGFADVLPCVYVTRVGGSNSTRVIDAHRLSVDCYASTWARATAAAADAVAALMALEGSTIADDLFEAPVYVTEAGLPYTNPDPEHPTVCRVTFTATLTVREGTPLAQPITVVRNGYTLRYLGTSTTATTGGQTITEARPGTSIDVEARSAIDLADADGALVGYDIIKLETDPTLSRIRFVMPFSGVTVTLR